jgi:signal transduction histidine kinase
MILAYLLIVLAVLGGSVALIVLRGDPKRWDNRVFAAMLLVDALTELLRGVEMFRGQQLTDAAVLHSCHVGSIIVAYFTIEFVYSYPFDRRMPRRARWPLMFFTLLTAIAAVHPALRSTFAPWTTYFYFLPYFAATLVLLFRNHQRLEHNEQIIGIRFVMLAVALRWVSAMSTFAVARNISPEAFGTMVLLDATIAMFGAYVLLAYAILHFQLFRVRGFLADVILYGGMALVILSVLGFFVELSLETARGPLELRIMLTALGLLPLAIVSFVRRMLPKIEERILHPIDPQRARMKDALAKVLEETSGKIDDQEIITRVEAILSDLTFGSVRFVEAPALDARHAIAVQRGNTTFGTLVLDAAKLDRDVLQTAARIADHLALKLENYKLFTQMLELKGELEEATRLAALGHFAAAIAHDIRTPLTSVQMNVQILRGKVDLPPDDMEYFDIALDELKRLNGNISELLDYAKPVQVKKSPLDLRELVEDAAKGVEPLLSDKHVEITKEHEADLPHVLGDASRIRQVLLNLLDNAANACAQGGGILLRTRRAGEERIALEVCDSGKGIEPAHLTKIFEPFFTTRADGTGLGLAIAQKLVRAHGGEIKVTSTLGRGSTFTIVLPAA